MNPDKNICKLIIEKISNKLAVRAGSFTDKLAVRVDWTTDKFDLKNIFNNILISIGSLDQKLLFNLIIILDELAYDRSIMFHQILQKYLFDTDLNIIDYFVLRETSIDYNMIKKLLSECNIDDSLRTNFVQKILGTGYQLTFGEIILCGEIIMAADSKSDKKTLLKYWNDAEYIKYLLYVTIVNKNKHLFKNISDQNEKSIVEFISKIIKNLIVKDIFCSGYFILVTIRKFFKFIIFDHKCPVRISYLLLKSRIKSLERAKEIESLRKENTYYKLHIENSPDSNLVKEYYEHFNSMIKK